MTKRQAIEKRLVNGALNGTPRQLEFLFKLTSKAGIPDPFEITSDDKAELRNPLDNEHEGSRFGGCLSPGG